MLDETLTTLASTNNIFSPSINLQENSKFCLIFKRSCLKQKHATYTAPNRIDFSIVYELGTWSRDWPLRLAITRDWPRDSPSEFSLPVGSMGKNVIIFGVGISSSVHIDNNKKNILIFGEGPTQGLDDTRLTAEAQYWINFSRSNRKSSLSLHCNGSNSFLFDHATKIYRFKVRNCEIKKYHLCSEIFQKVFQLITWQE